MGLDDFAAFAVDSVVEAPVCNADAAFVPSAADDIVADASAVFMLAGVGRAPVMHGGGGIDMHAGGEGGMAPFMPDGRGGIGAPFPALLPLIGAGGGVMPGAGGGHGGIIMPAGGIGPLAPFIAGPPMGGAFIGGPLPIGGGGGIDMHGGGGGGLHAGGGGGMPGQASIVDNGVD